MTLAVLIKNTERHWHCSGKIGIDRHHSHFLLKLWKFVLILCGLSSQALDLGKELIRLGHAVSCEDEGIGLRGDWDESRSLQKMLVRYIWIVLYSVLQGEAALRESLFTFNAGRHDRSNIRTQYVLHQFVRYVFSGWFLRNELRHCNFHGQLHCSCNLYIFYNSVCISTWLHSATHTTVQNLGVMSFLLNYILFS